MAFDGITISAVVAELNKNLTGGRFFKITQPEKDELLITVKNNSGQYRLLISSDPSLPLIYLTQENKVSPMTAPAFCMLLRKHLQNAKIISFKQPDFERIVRIELEHLNEMGDLCRKYLVVELMGRYSNIIFTDDEDNIIDSIRRVSGAVSSIREVLPGRKYYLPKVLEKKNPIEEKEENFLGLSGDKDIPVFKAIYTEYTGIAPIVAQSMTYRAQLSKNLSIKELGIDDKKNLWKVFSEVMKNVADGKFSNAIYYENGTVLDYATVDLPEFSDKKEFDNVSDLLFNFYSEKNIVSRIRQRSYDIRRVVQNAIERTQKKIDLQEKQLLDTEKRDQYRIYGELLNAFGYSAKIGDKTIEVLNYYDNKNINIPLDPTLSATDNAKKYFNKYNKLKRTYEHLSILTEENKKELMHLESIMTSLDIARNEEDLVEIKEELIESGYVRRRRNLKKPKVTSKPFHYILDEGFDVFVGKNNFQNDELTFKFANGNDIWFHAKNVPGSHVILKNTGDDIPDSAYMKAAALAAYYSASREQEKVEVDYTQKKNIKKPAGAAPGFVIYHTNYSMIVKPEIPSLNDK